MIVRNQTNPRKKYHKNIKIGNAVDVSTHPFDITNIYLRPMNKDKVANIIFYSSRENNESRNPISNISKTGLATKFRYKILYIEVSTLQYL